MTLLQQIFGVTKPLIAMCHLRCLPGRAEYFLACGLKRINDSSRERRFGSDDGEADAFLLREIDERLVGSVRDIGHAFFFRRARIAGRDEHA